MSNMPTISSATTDNPARQTRRKLVISSAALVPLGNVLRTRTGIQQKGYAMLNHLSWVLFVNKTWICVGKILTIHVYSSINVAVSSHSRIFSRILLFMFLPALSLLSGTTLLSTATVVAGSATVGLNYPYTILVNQTTDNAILVTDCMNHRVLRFYDNRLTIDNVSLLAQNWSGGNALNMPFSVAIHPDQKSTLYVSDFFDHYVIKLSNMQVISPVPTFVAGVKGTSGNGTNTLTNPAGIAVDKNGNLFVADVTNNRIMLWPPNSTSGTVVAGQTTAGIDALSFNSPIGIFLDANSSYMYISDAANHRIQRFALVGGLPVNNGTTVAGGHGPGSTNQQLNAPFSVQVSKKTGAMYIADSGNHRIQRWNPNEPTAVTVAGDPNGVSGGGPLKLSYPYGIALNDEETFLYVVDSGNHRVQRFDLV